MDEPIVLFRGDELEHHGVMGMRWGVWNEETRARHTGQGGPQAHGPAAGPGRRDPRGQTQARGGSPSRTGDRSGQRPQSSGQNRGQRDERGGQRDRRDTRNQRDRDRVPSMRVSASKDGRMSDSEIARMREMIALQKDMVYLDRAKAQKVQDTLAIIGAGLGLASSVDTMIGNPIMQKVSRKFGVNPLNVLGKTMEIISKQTENALDRQLRVEIASLDREQRATDAQLDRELRKRH